MSRSLPKDCICQDAAYDLLGLAIGWFSISPFGDPIICRIDVIKLDQNIEFFLK